MLSSAALLKLRKAFATPTHHQHLPVSLHEMTFLIIAFSLLGCGGGSEGWWTR